MTLKKESGVNSWLKGGLCCVSGVFFLNVLAGWEGSVTGSLKRHQVLFTLRKVRRSPLLPRIFCLPSEAFCDGSKHAAASAAHKHWEHSVTLLFWVYWIFIVHSLPSASGEHNKEKCWSKNCLGTNLCVIIQIKKTELSVRRVSPAYSPHRVKHELILCGSDTAVCTVLGEKDQIKRFLAF